MNGIDVSKHNGNIDFDKVKAAGYDFAIIRCGIGISTPKDPMFETNYSKAKAAGLDVGTYWFLRSLTPEKAKQEAKTCLDIIKGKYYEYPIYLDLEDDPNYGYYPFKTGKENCSAMVDAFCSEIRDAGYLAGLYTSKSILSTHIIEQIASKYALWVAQWSSKCTYQGEYGMWQKSGSGRVNGVVGDVDLDECYTDYPQLVKLLGVNGYTKQTDNLKYRYDLKIGNITISFDNKDEAQSVLKSAKIKTVKITG